jgi:hypothetical protein
MQRASLAETYEPFLGRTAVEDFIAAGNVERCFEERWEQATVATFRGEIVGVAVREGALLDPGADEFSMVCQSLPRNGSVRAWKGLACSR